MDESGMKSRPGLRQQQWAQGQLLAVLECPLQSPASISQSANPSPPSPLDSLHGWDLARGPSPPARGG